MARQDDLHTQYMVLADTGQPGVYASTYAEPDDLLWEGLTGHLRSETGIHVSADKALTFAPWFQGIGIISGDVASVALDVYSRDDDDDRQKQREHPAYELLNRQPNPMMTSFTFRETLTSSALSWGNGYAAIIWQGAKPGSLIPIAGDSMWPERLTDNRVVFVHRQPDGTDKFYSADDILHIRGLGTALAGHSVYRYARESLGLGLAAQRHGARHFSNDARPGLLLKWPATLDKPAADELLAQWEDRHKRHPNRPALLTGGLDAIPVAGSNEDSQWIESRKFSRDEVASWLSLPPHKLGSDARLSYNSVEAEERSYVSQTLMRWLKRWEGECDVKLLSTREKKAWWYFEHNTGALIQGDYKTQADVLVQLKNAKIISQNEARKKLNMNAVEDGDVFENAMTSSGKAPDNPAPNQETRVALQALIADRMLQLARTEKTTLKELARGNSPAASIEHFYDRFLSKIVAAMCPCFKAYATVANCLISPHSLAVRYCDESQEIIRGVLVNTPGNQIADALDATVENWPDTRPQQVVLWMERG
jgi:HK97 family phage portal protein